MTFSLYDLPNTQRDMVYSLFDAVKERFSDVTTDFDIWLNPDNSEHLLVNVHVPFYDDDRELEFRDFAAELSCALHEQSGILVSLMPQYIPAMEAAALHEAV